MRVVKNKPLKVMIKMI